MRIANRVLHALEVGQMTLADLVELTDLPIAVVQRSARANWNPPLDVAVRIAWAVDLPIDKLFWLEPSEGAR